MFTLSRMLKAKNESQGAKNKDGPSLAQDPLLPTATPLDNLADIDTDKPKKDRIVFYAGAGIIALITYLSYKRPGRPPPFSK